MKFIKLSPVSRWTLATGFTFLVFMLLMRLIFFIHFKTTGYSFSNCMDAMILGLRYDLRVACGVVLPMFLIGNLNLVYTPPGKLSGKSILTLIIMLCAFVFIIFLLKNNHKASALNIILITVLFAIIFLWLFIKKSCNPFRDSLARKVWKTYFLIASVLLPFFYAMDFEHFGYLHQRLNASVLNYAEDAKISMSMVWQTYPVITLFIAIFIVSFLLSWLVRRSYKTIRLHVSYSYQRFLSLALFVLLIAGVFGRLGQFPLRWSDAFRFGDEFKASLSLNPVQSFFSTLQFRHSSYDDKKVHEYYPLMSSYLGVQNADSTKLNYQRNYQPADTGAGRPNVVIVICESFSAYKSSMWGNPLNTTPYFNEMCKKGIFFDHCFTPAYGTARGVWAVVTGIPDVENPNTASRNPAAVDQHTIINDLSGYDKFYFLGGSTSWANIRGLLTNNITDLHLYEEGSYKAKAVDVWGISDKHLFLEANDVLKQQPSPFFAVIQTADNHRPYTIPSEDMNEFAKKEFPADTLKKYGFTGNDELNAFRYTDFCYQKFIESAKKEKYFANTIFVFVGDHGIRGEAGNMFPRCWTTDGVTTQHVPLLFYSPALLQPARINKTCSQVDILPSVSALIKHSYSNTTIGRNLFDTASHTSLDLYDHAFLFDPDEQKIGMMSNEFCYIKNLLTGKEDFSSSQNNDPVPADPYTEKQRSLLVKLTDAYYQTAKYMLLNNKKGALH